jgi:hypothetical protein
VGAAASRLLIVSFVFASTATLGAAELTDAATLAFAEYAAKIRQAFVARVAQPVNPTDAVLPGDRPMVRPGGGDGILDAPDSLIHHWFAALVIPGVTLDQVLQVSRDYKAYPQIFRPIVRANVLSESDDMVRIQLRMRESAGGMTATLDVRSNVRYDRPDARHAYSISNSEEIREVEDAGRSTEHQLPAGRDSGYLWRAGALTRFVEIDAGVYMEMETIGLSRPFPRMLGWVIEPIARRIGRRSVETSVQEFRAAVLSRVGKQRVGSRQ